MSPTTTNGLPYPLPSDPVAHGADDIRRLAEAIDPFSGDTGWITVPITDTTNFANFSAGVPIQVRRIGKLVEVRGVIKLLTAGYVSNTRIFAMLPAGFAPSGQTYPSVQQMSSIDRWYFSVAVNTGALQVDRLSGTPGGTVGLWMPFNGSYMLG